MTSERWRRIEDIFEAALQIEGAAREAFLASRAEDELFRREVESLLAAHERAGSFIGRPAAEVLGREAPAEPAVSWRGRQIGVYTVIDEIGRGGMGRILLAEREDREYRSRVAIKVVDTPLAVPQVVERFRRERQILADLHHPYIARLLDGGTLPEGLPYLVMDLVEGTPIDRFCDEKRLTVEERILLFREVCAAVQYAHQRLVVHRDLKPANVLVTPAGSPRLLDFGIAKLLEGGGDEDLTRTRHLPMTPRYASPEQIRGGRVTTAADVYSLGVLLYELLAGRSPYDVEGLPLPEVVRRVAEIEPPRPSAAAAAAGESAARARRLTHSHLRRRLAGDLDTVVLTALRKDPERRYGSVEQLSEDLRRYLEERPVAARPDTVAYRAGKFVRRNRLAASLGASLTASLLAFSVVLAAQGQRAGRERDKAEQSLDFLVDVFRQADPAERAVREQAGELTVREVLDLGARRISRELAGQPVVRATLLNAVGEAYLSLGLPRQALPLHEEALEVARRATGPRSELAAASLHGMAAAYEAVAEYAVAEERFRQAVELRRKRLGRAHPDTLATATSLGATLGKQERIDEAEALLGETLERAQREHGRTSLEVAGVLTALADLRWRAGGHRETEELRREAMAIRKQVLGDDHYLVAEDMNELGTVLHERGQRREAVELYRRAREIWLPLLDEDHPLLLMNQNSVAMALKDEGHYAEAADLLQWLVERRRALQGERTPEYVYAVNNLATLETDRGNWTEAARLWSELLDVVRGTFGERSWMVAGCRANMAFVAREQGDLERAERLNREAVELLRDLYGDENRLIGRPLTDMGRIALARGDLEAARAHLGEALALWRRMLPPGHAWTAMAERELGAVYLALGRYAEAEPLLLSGFLDENGEPKLHGTKRIRALRRLVELYRVQGRESEARRHERDLATVRADLLAQSGLGDPVPSS